MALTPRYLLHAACAATLVATAACQSPPAKVTPMAEPEPVAAPEPRSPLDAYATVTLTAPMEHLTPDQREMISLLIEASEIMDALFWKQAYGDRETLLAGLDDPDQRRFAEINYGPWDRLNGDAPFVDGAGEKPAGARFYPADMSREEFEAAEFEGKDDLYSLVRRDYDGTLMAVPYSEAYHEELGQAALLLAAAAERARDPELRRYLTLRARALITDDYQPSDLAWMDMKSNEIDVVIGAIETYEDQLFGYRAAYESYVLLKDMEWSRRLAKFAAFLPELQRGLPVSGLYKAEDPGSDSDLNAYDVIYYAGHSNAGAKTIAINLPNDEEVQLSKGTRRLQLKNAMRAKFDEILVPIAEDLIVPDQRKHVTFDAFFANTMFHEVAHGLGVKNTVTGNQLVRRALREHASAVEEGKADVLGLYMVTWLHERGELEGELEDFYVTFMASIFRSVRFGASSAHGRANMIRFNFFRAWDAFTRDDETGHYSIDMARMRQAVDALSAELLVLQGNGDYEGAGELIATMGNVPPVLQQDLDRLSEAGIPVDIVFEQGPEVLGLAAR